MQRPLGIGIIGSGFAAHFHLASHQKIYGGRFTISAIASRNHQSASRLAERFGIPSVLSTAEAVLQDPSIDIVDISAACAPYPPGGRQRQAHHLRETPGRLLWSAWYRRGWRADDYSRQTMFGEVAGQMSDVSEAIERAGISFCYGENWIYAPPIAKLDRLMAASRSTIMRVEGEESQRARLIPR